MNRNASGARRTSQHRTGGSASSPADSRPITWPQDLPQPVRAGLVQIERPVDHARIVRGDLVGVADVGLAHLHERPATRQQPQGRVGQLTGQRVQHDVDPGTPGRGQERLLEPGVARRRDVRRDPAPSRPRWRACRATP